MALALYRKYRSRRLDDIVGQSHVTDILARAIERDRVAHAYLFTGPRGVGKTSIARILAHEINDLKYTDESNHLDIIEIDAASNNGVDDIRDLREKVQLAPVNAKKKVYIIDEVHMLSKPAFNALLKTLEEPPAHVVFILATTDADKLPETIISRTQRHTFRRATRENIVKNLRSIAKKESIKIDDAALRLIAQHSDGSYRDSISLLDQLSNTASGDTVISTDLVEASLGLAPEETVSNLLEAIRAQDFTAVIAQLGELESSGIQPKVVASQLVMRLMEQATASPELLSVLDELLTVGQSSLPNAKLLAVLGTYCAQHAQATPKLAAALVVPAPRTVIRSLEEKATEEAPKDDLVKPKQAVRKIAKNATPVELPWNEIITGAKEKSIGLHSVLEKCTAEAVEGTLTIYARNEFYKKKLDTSKYRQELQDVLTAVTKSEWDIVTIPGLKPPKNSHVAAVAAMMGGGEEVSVDETL